MFTNWEIEVLGFSNPTPGHTDTLHDVYSKTCLVDLLIRSIFREKNCTSASAVFPAKNRMN